MTPAIYVISGVLIMMLAVGLIYFGASAYYLASTIKEAGDALIDLSFNLQGLPHNLHGVSPALAKLADGVAAHESQVAGLVAVIADANKGIPPDKPPPFEENGKDTRWDAHIPQTDIGNEE